MLLPYWHICTLRTDHYPALAFNIIKTCAEKGARLISGAAAVTHVHLCGHVSKFNTNEKRNLSFNSLL